MLIESQKLLVLAPTSHMAALAFNPSIAKNATRIKDKLFFMMKLIN